MCCLLKPIERPSDHLLDPICQISPLHLITIAKALRPVGRRNDPQPHSAYRCPSKVGVIIFESGLYVYPSTAKEICISRLIFSLSSSPFAKRNNAFIFKLCESESPPRSCRLENRTPNRAVNFRLRRPPQPSPLIRGSYQRRVLRLRPIQKCILVLVHNDCTGFTIFGDRHGCLLNS
jgi:hypothetical protein